MSSASVWDDADLRAGGDYVRFEDVGDKVSGTVEAIRIHTFEDGKKVPQVIMTIDGEERTMTAGQVRLKAALAEQRPEVGDTLSVELTEVEKRAGGKTLKHFTVTVTRAGAGATPAAAAAPVTADEAVAAGGITEEQRAALAKLGL